MSRIRSLLCGALLAAPVSAMAVPPSAPIDAAPETAQVAVQTTGDDWIDARLRDIDVYGARYREPFIDELARYHNAPRALVVELLDAGWRAGDLYFACALASTTGRPCRAVSAARAPDRPWQDVAAGFGLTEGSTAQRRLKRAIVDSYQRWGRPLVLDAELSALMPRHPGARGLPAPPEPRDASD